MRNALRRGRLVAIFVATIMLATPTLLLAQDNTSATMIDDYQQGREDGKRDGQGKASAAWYAAGCCLGVTGLLASYIINPSVPAGAMLGKSPEYAKGYSEGYQEQVKGEQTKKAWIGCGALTVAYVLYVAVIVAAIDDADDDIGP